jgi:predicted phosphodiesterase
MKTFIASDFHGKNPVPLVQSLAKSEGIERAVFLGDYDEPKILRDIMDLEMDKIVLMGNHDHDFCFGRQVYSSNLRKPLKEYWKMWGETVEGKYGRECAKITKGIKRGLKVVRRIGDKRAVYVHGSLVSIRSEDPSEVWGRILHGDWGFTKERRLICNFREMKKDDYWTMFRGHDHFSVVFSTNKKDYNENVNQINSSIDNVVLKKEDMNIVSVGAFVEGEYALFDDSTRELKFKNMVYD